MTTTKSRTQNPVTDKIQDTIDKLATQRDELRLQMSLATAEAKAHWEKAEAKWENVQAKLAETKTATSARIDELHKTISVAVGEIAQAYQNIKASLSR